MTVVHFFEDNAIILSQLRKNIPSVDENIKIKGRKGKVMEVKEIEENEVHVYVIFEQVVKKKALLTDTKKKKR